MSGFGKRGSVQPSSSGVARPLQRTEAGTSSVPVTRPVRAPRDLARPAQSLATVTPIARSTIMPALGRPEAATSAAPTRDDGLRRYMQGVYVLMMLGVAMSGAVTLFLISQPALLKTLASHPLFFAIVFLGTLGLSWFSKTIIETRSIALGHAFFWTYAILWGAGLAPMIGYLASIGAVGIVAKAFFISAGLFGGASLYGYTTKKDLTGIGYFFCLLTWGILLATVVNCVLFQSSGLSLAFSYAVVVIFTVITAYETQMLKDMYLTADDDAHRESMLIFGAFELYGSFMMIFSRMLHVCWSLYDELA